MTRFGVIFATLAHFQKSLAIFLRVHLLFCKCFNLLWHVFAIGQIFIHVCNEKLNKQFSLRVTLVRFDARILFRSEIWTKTPRRDVYGKVKFDTSAT